jgi:hypothetical protein
VTFPRTATKVLILDRGAAEVVYPADWSAELKPEGHMRLVDPTDACSLEISLLPFRLSEKAELPVDHLLVETLSSDGREAGEIRLEARGDLRLAWADTSYECDDAERGQRRVAHCRYLLVSNGLFTALLSFNYWRDDADWAVPAWQRIAASLQLGDGVRLAGPEEHWSLRKPS